MFFRSHQFYPEDGVVGSSELRNSSSLSHGVKNHATRFLCSTDKRVYTMLMLHTMLVQPRQYTTNYGHPTPQQRQTAGGSQVATFI
jgi:hypothetical protein